MVYSTFLYHFLAEKTRVCGTPGIFPLKTFVFTIHLYILLVKLSIQFSIRVWEGHMLMCCALYWGPDSFCAAIATGSGDLFLPSFCSEVHSKCLCAMKIAWAVNNQEHSWQHGCFFSTVCLNMVMSSVLPVLWKFRHIWNLRMCTGYSFIITGSWQMVTTSVEQ